MPSGLPLVNGIVTHLKPAKLQKLVTAVTPIVWPSEQIKLVADVSRLRAPSIQYLVPKY